MGHVRLISDLWRDGLDTTNGYDTRCLDFETKNVIIFLIAQDELDIKNGSLELMYDVCEDSFGGRKNAVNYVIIGLLVAALFLEKRLIYISSMEKNILFYMVELCHAHKVSPSRIIVYWGGVLLIKQQISNN